MNAIALRVPVAFPPNPAIDDEFTASNGATYVWDGVVWMAGSGAGGGGGGGIIEPVGPGTWGRLQNATWQRAVALSGDVLTGGLEIGRDPITNDELARKQYIDNAVQAALLDEPTGPGTFGRLAAGAWQRSVALAGDAMDGELLLRGPITDPLAAVTREWVEGLASGSLYAGPWQVAANVPDLLTSPHVRGTRYLCLTVDPATPEIANAAIPGIGGRTITDGSFILWDEPLQQWDLIQAQIGGGMSQDQGDLRYLQLIGGVLTGPLSVNGNITAVPAPSLPGHLATKQYVDGLAGGPPAGYMRRDGDTMTGLLTLSGAPAANLHAATKLYVDSTVASGGGSATGPGDFNPSTGIVNSNIQSMSHLIGAVRLNKLTGFATLNTGAANVGQQYSLGNITNVATRPGVTRYIIVPMATGANNAPTGYGFIRIDFSGQVSGYAMSASMNTWLADGVIYT